MMLLLSLRLRSNKRGLALHTPRVPPARFFLSALWASRAEKPQGKKISSGRLRSLLKFSVLAAYMPPLRIER